MKHGFNIILLLLISLLSFSVSSQTIEGTVQFQDATDNFSFTGIQANEERTRCDASGHFTISSDTQIDTLSIYPFPTYVKVKFVNLPKDMDTITITSIPLFPGLIRRIPVINFRTKRASKKYFRKLEKERVEKESSLQQRIEAYSFTWGTQEYALKYINMNGDPFILIDLAN